MKCLFQYLDEDFTLAQKGEIMAMLETCQIVPVIEKIAQLLKNTGRQSPDIGIISSSLVISINNSLKAFEPGTRQKAELLFADLIFAIFIDFLNNKDCQYNLTLTKIKRHSFFTCNLMGYDFNVFKKLIDICAANALNAKYAYSSKITAGAGEIPKCKLIWTKKGRLEELVYQLAERKLIRNRRAFFDLFLKMQTEDILVKWDFERKGHLAFLLYELYKKELIAVTSNRGYFSYAEKHFIGIDGTVLKPNTLKKISSAIHTQPLRHHQIIEDVNEILNKVTAVH